MPDAAGNFKGARVPLVPWKQEFKVGDRVRVVSGPWAGEEGVVVDLNEAEEYPVAVELGDSWFPHKPGELRLVDP